VKRGWLKRLWAHRTKLVGGLQATNGIIGTTTALPAKVTAWLALVLGLAAVWIGIFNTSQDKKE
jgi:hypothetical protein